MQGASPVEARRASGQKHRRLACPECGEALHRSHRRPVEKLVSIVVPLRRYKCHHCGWSGLRSDAYRPHLRLDGKFLLRALLVVMVCLGAIGIAVWMTLRLEGGVAVQGVLLLPLFPILRSRHAFMRFSM